MTFAAKSKLARESGKRRRNGTGAVDLSIDDSSLGRRILIASSGCSTAVVWNPWVDKAKRMGDMGENGYLNMVCVESANAADDVVTIAPGDEHHLQVSYRLESLAGKRAP